MLYSTEELQRMYENTSACVLILDHTYQIIHQNSTCIQKYPKMKQGEIFSNFLDPFCRDKLWLVQEKECRIKCYLNDVFTDIYVQPNGENEARYYVLFLEDHQVVKVDMHTQNQMSRTARILNEPITNISVSCAVLKKRLKNKLEEAELKYFDQIDGNVMLLLKHINNMSEVINIAAQTEQELELALVNVDDSITELLEQINPYMLRKEVNIAYAKHNKEIFVALDESKFSKAMLQILAAAFRRSGKGDTVSIDLYDYGDYIKLSIRCKTEKRPRQSAEDVALHFDPFSASEKRRKEDMMLYDEEIGLFIAKNYVRMHNGTIRIQMSDHYTEWVFTVSKKIHDATIIKECDQHIRRADLKKYVDIQLSNLCISAQSDSPGML